MNGEMTLRAAMFALAAAATMAVQAVPQWISGDSQDRAKPAPVLEKTFGVRWEVRNAKSGDLVSEGLLTEQMPTISSSTPLKFSASVPDGEVAEVSIRKEYE